MDVIRRAVLIDIAYEAGGAGLAKFVKFLAAMRESKWSTAAAELKDSLLYTQVPRREHENMLILALGTFPFGVNSAEDLIKRHEGCVLTAKPDAKGKWAIGWGHDIDAPEDSSAVITCTHIDADAWFTHDFTLATQRAKDALGAEYWGDK